MVVLRACQRHFRARTGSLAPLLIGALLVVGAPQQALAEPSAVLARMLKEGRNFRVRTRAAVALGRSGDPRQVLPLVRALHRDPHPAVRQAAIVALNALAAPVGRYAVVQASRRDRSDRVRAKALAALRTWRAPTEAAPVRTNPRSPRPDASPLRRDGESPDWQRVRHAVVVGDVSNRSGRFGGALVARTKRQLRRELGVRPAVVVVEPGTRTDAVADERELPRYRIDANVSRLERSLVPGQMQVRCEVTLIMMDEPGRSIRSVMRGAATSMGPLEDNPLAQERKLAVVAVDRALASAVENAMRALRSTGPSVALGDPLARW